MNIKYVHCVGYGQVNFTRLKGFQVGTNFYVLFSSLIMLLGKTLSILSM